MARSTYITYVVKFVSDLWEVVGLLRTCAKILLVTCVTSVVFSRYVLKFVSDLRQVGALFLVYAKVCQ